MKKKFNVNSEILVKLRENGFIHWKKHEDAIFSHHSTLKYQRSIAEYKSLMDANGYIKFQMWDFFRIFGNELRNGMNILFDTDIILEDDDLVAL